MDYFSMFKKIVIFAQNNDIRNHDKTNIIYISSRHG